MKKKQSIKLDVSANGNRIDYIEGALPYLWIGSSKECVGCVPDEQVKRLRGFCDKILKARKKG